MTERLRPSEEAIEATRTTICLSRDIQLSRELAMCYGTLGDMVKPEDLKGLGLTEIVRFIRIAVEEARLEGQIEALDYASRSVPLEEPKTLADIEASLAADMNVTQAPKG